ncbi:MAG: hypothetical protein HQM09_19035 [Candidatus Riflebacteria bacterium]|nr:hypothetical protein [Candidatus Riflebacteria bacterium]
MKSEYNVFEPAGFMGKFIIACPEWIKNERVKKIYSVSGCISRDFADYIKYWLHNKFWFFNEIKQIQEICDKEAIDFRSLDILFYEVYYFQFFEERKSWETIIFEDSFKTEIQIPRSLEFLGHDIVSYYAGSAHECSVLSCNGLADEFEVNEHCLITDFDLTKSLVERLQHCEPGPYRIIRVNKANLAA